MISGQQLKHIRAVLFDLDGTLLHTSPDLAVAANAALAECGHPAVDAALVESYVGKGIDVLIMRCLAHLGLPDHGAVFDAMRAAYMRHYAVFNGAHATPYPGVFEGLDALRGMGIRLGVCTNKTATFTDPLLAHAGMSSYFAVIVSGDTATRKKPDAAPILFACQALGTLPHQTLMVGDSVNDAGAARAAGSPVLIVPYGYNEGEPVQDIDSDGIVSNLAEIAALLQKARRGEN